MILIFRIFEGLDDRDKARQITSEWLRVKRFASGPDERDVLRVDEKTVCKDFWLSDERL